MSKHSKKLVPVSTAGENDTVPKPFSYSAKGNSLKTVKSGFIAKKPTAPKSVTEKSVQTDHPDVSLVTGEEPTLEYWKLLSERIIKENGDLKQQNKDLKRKLELAEEEVQQNKDLKKKLELAEEEVKTLEEMLEDAKKMAAYFQDLPDSTDSDGD